MIAHAQPCSHDNRKKHGKDRKGRQRWRCLDCGVTFYTEERRPLGDMRVDLDKACTVLNMLLEGMSIRAAARITGMDKDTICDLILVAGENCDRFMRERIKDVKAERIELDELWDFVAMKEATKKKRQRSGEVGDVWTWLAIDSDSKLILAQTVGQRDETTCRAFLSQVNYATDGPCQVTSDGLKLYRYNVPFTMGSRVDFAQLIKVYGGQQEETRYSPAKIISSEKVVRFGNPDEELISTSYVERLNLSVRMHVRRYTRLTNAHSKTARHHAAMTALFAAWYNFCRVNTAHEDKVTPAESAKLTDHRWTIAELLKAAA